MKLAFDEKYKDRNKNMFPSDALPNEKKDKQYCLEASKAIVSRYVNGATELPYARRTTQETIETLRNYASGNQGVDMYKDVLIGRKSKKDGCRPKSTMNISWRTMDILPKKISDVEGYIAKIKYDVVPTAIDRQAIIAKDSIKALTKLAIKDRARMFHQELNEAYGEDIVTMDEQLANQPTQLPFMNDQQVELFAENGGFQLEQEIAIDILNDRTDEVSGEDVIDLLRIKDMTRLGIVVTKSYNDAGSMIEKKRYVDPARAIIPYSIYPDFRDATYFGEIRRISIYELRKESDLSEDEIIGIAKLYNDSNHNQSIKLDEFYHSLSQSKNNGLGLAVLDSIEVDIADVVWLGTRQSKHSKIIRKDGTLSFNKTRSNYRLSESDKKKGKELKEYTTQCVYKAKHVIGTDVVFDYGPDNNIAFEKTISGRRIAILPYSAYKTGDKSIVERCMGFVDDINIALFKKRMAIKNLSTGPNIMIRKSAFDNVRIDNKLQSPAELMALYTNEGFLIVDDATIFSSNSSQARAIDSIPVSITEQLMECRAEIAENIKNIEDVTGVNQVFSGSSPDKEQGLGVSQLAVNATENSVFLIIDALKKQKEHSTRITTHRWKVSSRYMSDKDRERLGVSRSLKYVSIGKDIAEYDFDLKLEAGISDEEMRMLQQEITQLADFRRQAGVGGIMPSDRIYLFEVLKNRNLKQARMILSQIEEFRAMEDEQAAQRRYKENADLQQQSNEQASNNELARIEAEGDVKKDIEYAKIMAQIELERVRGAEQRKTVASQNVYGWGLQTYQKGGVK